MMSILLKRIGRRAGIDRTGRAVDRARPIPCVCGVCQGKAVIYPEPAPRGTCVCESCTPEWFRQFARARHEASETGLSG